VEDAAARRALIELLELAMRDNVGVWTLNGDAAWVPLRRREGEPSLEMQRELMRRASQRS